MKNSKLFSIIFLAFIFSISATVTTGTSANDSTISWSFDDTTNITTLTLSDPSKKYLILTIDETTDSQEIYRSNDVKGNVNDIRLIRVEGHYDHIYEVPYEIKNDGTIYINKASKDWVVWNYLRTSNEYDASNRETIFRPGYHHTPLWGWMNDPNGLVFDGEYYHLFYQYNPYSSWWDNMAWGHSRSKNLLNWDHRQVAIERFEGGNIFSGSVVNDVDGTAFGDGKGGLIAYFTVRGHFPVEDLWYQHNWAAYSTDKGENWIKYNYNDTSKDIINPILVPEEQMEYQKQHGNSEDTLKDWIRSSYYKGDYRDPKIVKYIPDTNKTADSFYVLLISADTEYRIYQNMVNGAKSKDFIHWTKVSSFGYNYGVDPRYMQYECPDMVRLFPAGSQTSKWVFIANINPGAPFGGSATEYFTGSFDGTTYTSDHTFPKFMDFGKDHYAAVTYSNLEDRQLIIPWASNWNYAKVAPTFQYRSANGLPRELGIFRYKGEYWVSSTPCKETELLLSSATVYSEADFILTKKRKKVIKNIFSGSSYTGMVKIDFYIEANSKAKKYGFTYYNDEGEKVDFFFDRKPDKLWNKYSIINSGSFVMDRRFSGKHEFLNYGAREWDINGREELISKNVYKYQYQAYKYVNPFYLGTKMPLGLLNSKKTHVEIYYDRSLFEVFLDGGKLAMTNTVFPASSTNPYYNHIKFYNEKGTVKISNLKIYSLNPPTSSDTTL